MSDYKEVINDADFGIEDEGYGLLPLSSSGKVGSNEAKRPWSRNTRSSLLESLTRRRFHPLLILSICVIAIYFALHRYDAAWISSIDTEIDDLVKEQTLQRLRYLQERIGRKHLQEDVVIKDLDEDFGLSGYTARLHRMYEQYFAPRGRYAQTRGPYKDMWEQVEKHLIIGAAAPVTDGNSSRVPRLISSSIRNSSDVPVEFEKWQENNPAWEVQLYNDTRIEEYIQREFGSMGRPEPQVGDTSSNFIDQWHHLPYSILRVDSFRYLKVFLEGGVYSDSDTAGLYPIEKWPGMSGPHHKVIDRSDDVLHLLDGLKNMHHQQRSHKKGISPKVKETWSQDHSSNNFSSSWTQPGLVLAIEYDAPGTGKVWKEVKLARPLQITQFAFLAEPFHPVLLDCLGTIMDFQVKYHNETIPTEGEEYRNLILDWTGPGVFTDAVYRYLVARYGFEPFYLAGNGETASRIGDVLIYPEFAFLIDQWHHLDKDFELIYHGFMHRWIDERDDKNL